MIDMNIYICKNLSLGFKPTSLLKKMVWNIILKQNKERTMTAAVCSFLSFLQDLHLSCPRWRLPSRIHAPQRLAITSGTQSGAMTHIAKWGVKQDKGDLKSKRQPISSPCKKKTPRAELCQSFTTKRNRQPAAFWNKKNLAVKKKKNKWKQTKIAAADRKVTSMTAVDLSFMAHGAIWCARG